MSALKLSFIIEAIDRATRPVRAVNERMEKITEPVRKIRASINALVRESGLTRIADQAQVVGEKFNGVTSAIKGIGAAGFVAAAGAAAMWLPMKNVIDQGSKINDTAAMLGVSSREFQRLSYALTLDGSSAEDAATSLRFLQKNAVEALTGSKEMTTWFRRAGMSSAFLKKNLNDPIAMVHKLSDAMAKNVSPAQRIALMQNLLGRGGARNAQTMARGSAELKRLGDQAEQLGAVMDEKTVEAMDEAGDSIMRMERALGGVMNLITAVALPVIERVSKATTAWAVGNRAMIATRVGEFVERLAQNLPQIADTTIRIIGAVGSAIIAVDGIVRAIGGWDVVVNTIAVVLGGKLLIAVVSFTVAVASLAAKIWSFLQVLAIVVAVPLAPLIAAIGLLGAAAFMIYRNWAPIAEFFTNLWAGITSAATDGIEFVMGKINAVIAFVQSAILKLDSMTPEWVKKWTLPGAALSAAANAVRPSAVPSAIGAPGAGRTDVGGTIKIEIDQQGRARVGDISNDNPNVGFDVDSGMMFAGA